jgi:hypothetical protein
MTQWWNQFIFVLDGKTRLTRKDVVLAAADKHGGAHVDTALTPEYERLISSHDLGSWVVNGAEPVPIEGHHYVALRQMGYEVLHSTELTDLTKWLHVREVEPRVGIGVILPSCVQPSVDVFPKRISTCAPSPASLWICHACDLHRTAIVGRMRVPCGRRSG